MRVLLFKSNCLGGSNSFLSNASFGMQDAYISIASMKYE